MISKIKVLGLAFVAVTAMSAMAASAAQAGTIHVGANPAVTTGHIEPLQQHTLEVPDPPKAPFKSQCEEATFEGTVQGVGQTLTIDEFTVTPTYGKCKLAGQAATVQMNGCKYTLTGTKTDGQEHAAFTWTVDIVDCTAGKQIQIKSAICTVDIPMQNHLSHIIIQNTPAPNDKTIVTVEANVQNITAVQTGAACPQGNNAHTTAAGFKGNTEAEAFVDAGTALVTKHGHQYTEHKCGAMVELIAT